jgi:pyruvate ferredoxin oxidoreductase beta subunit
VAYLRDLQKKVKRAMEFQGPRYIQIDTPCPSVWGFPSDRTLEVGRLGVQSGLIPLFEMEAGEIVHVRKIKKKVPVKAYLKTQKRYRHLLDGPKGEAELAEIQAIADANIKKFDLMGKPK